MSRQTISVVRRSGIAAATSPLRTAVAALALCGVLAACGGGSPMAPATDTDRNPPGGQQTLPPAAPTPPAGPPSAPPSPANTPPGG